MFLKYNYTGIIWAIIILVLLGIPPNDLPSNSFLNIPHRDKIIHGILFLIFVILLVRGFTLQNQFQLLSKYFLLSSFFISITYGGLTEILQRTIFTQRNADIIDFISDFVGSLVGILLFVLFKTKIMPEKS